MSNQPTSSPIDPNSDAFLDLALKGLRREEADVILIVEKDEAVRAALRRTLQPLFESFEIQEVEDSVAAVQALREELNKRVVLVLAEVDERQGIEYLAAQMKDTLNDDRIPGMDNVPLIAVFGDMEANGGGGVSAERYLNHDLIDGAVKKPFDVSALRRGIATAIARREGAFHESENRLRPKVLREFVEYYRSLLAVWKSDLKNVSFFPADPAAVTPNTREADLIQLWKFIEKFNGLLTIMESAGENIDVNTLRKIIHDANNALSVPFAYITFILDTAPSEQDVVILKKLQNDAYQLDRYLKQIRNAYRGRGTWNELQESRPVLQLRNSLGFPDGTVFCVVDDDEAIIKVTGRTIEQAGGKAITATDRQSLARALDEVGPDGVQVVLLDNNLGKDPSGADCFGHELISLIRTACPEVLIIAHTSDAPSLNSCSTNPYKSAGVEIVDKRGWNAISGIIRRKMKKRPGDVSTVSAEGV